jgi:hypothetical protein
VPNYPKNNAKGIKAMPDDEDSEQSIDDQSGSQQTAEDQNQGQPITDDQSASQATESDQQASQDQGTDESAEQTTDEQSQDQQTTDDQGSSQQTTEDQSQAQETTDEQSQDQQTTDDQGSSQATQAGAEESTKSFVGQNTGATQTQSTGTADWRARAKRALTVLQNDSSGEATRTKCMFNHILEESHSDSYVSKDFYNVQQTAGGLPASMSMEQFLAAITGHIRAELASSSFGSAETDSVFRDSVLTFDSNIRRHITFLNGVVHQAAPGKVHLALWKLILDSRSDSNSIYKCYADYLVDA